MKAEQLHEQKQDMNGMCGSIITWAVRGAFVSREVLSEALERNGIPTHIAKTEPRTFLRRAIKECTSERLVRKLGESSTEVCFALVDEHGNLAERKWDGQQDVAITLNKISGDVAFTKDSPLSERILAAINNNQEGLISQEIARVIRDVLLLHADAMRIRGQGGAYFVPEYKRDILAKVDDVLDEIRPPGSQVRMFRFDVIKNSRSAEDTTVLLRTMLEEEVEQVISYCKNIVREDASRPSTFQKRGKDVAAMIAKANRFEKLLGTDLQETLGRLAKAKKLIYKLYLRKALEKRMGK